MNKYIIVEADAGISGNFLVRLLSFSQAIPWNSDSTRHHEIVSKEADNQWIHYCWTSLCHTVVNAVSNNLVKHWYTQARMGLDSDTWRAIKMGSTAPSVWFFHKVDEEIYNDPDTIVVRLMPSLDFDMQMWIDRRYFNGDELHHTLRNEYSWMKHVRTAIREHVNFSQNPLQGNFITFYNEDIFNVVRVMELMKQLGLYHSGLGDVLHEWIRIYRMKNARPAGLITNECPTEYAYAEQVDQIADPYIQHYIKCVNRKTFDSTVDCKTIEDPVNLFKNYRTNLIDGDWKTADDDLRHAWNAWKSQVVV